MMSSNIFKVVIQNIINKSSGRSILLGKNIVISFFNKLFAVIVSFLLVSVTINYVSAEEYGIWLTLSSLIHWVAMFDFGLTHGFRNRFAESVAQGNNSLCIKYVSTTFFILFVVFSMLMMVLIIANNFCSWSSLFKIDALLEPTLKHVILIISVCFCLKNIFKVTTTMFAADQRPAISSVIGTLENFLILIIIWFLTKTTKGSLTYLAAVSSGIPLFIIILVTIFAFSSKRYRIYKPSIRNIDLSLSNKILVLGGKFFVIQLCMLVIFQTINIIISRSLGPEYVTIYNVAHKYYSITNSIFIIILAPFWSAITDAFSSNDFSWIIRSINKLKNLFLILCLFQVILFIISPWLIKLWIGDSVTISWRLSFFMAINVILLSYSQLYMYIINGIGKVTLQMIIYLLFAVFSIPLMSYSTQLFGIEGVLLLTSIIYLTLGVLGKIQVNKILTNTAFGIWNI